MFEEIISNGDWKFIGRVEEVSARCYGNNQTSLSARGPVREVDHVKLSIGYGDELLEDAHVSV